MNIFTALVLMVLIVSVAGVLGTVLSARHRAERGLRKDWLGSEVPIVTDQTNGEARHEIEELRERVKVLERIVTDANSGGGREARAIADQIESLRDK